MKKKLTHKAFILSLLTVILFSAKSQTVKKDSIALLNPRITYYSTKADSKYKQGNYLEAILNYDSLIRLDPKIPEMFYNRGRAKIRLGNLRGAELDFTQAISLSPNTAKYYYSKGELQTDQDAILSYGKAIELKPDYYQAYCNRANSKIMLYQDTSALRDLNKAIQLNPMGDGAMWAFETRGNLKLALEDYEGAVEDLTLALSLCGDPADQPNLYCSRSIAYSHLKKEKKAIRDCDRAIQSDPRNEGAYCSRAIAKCHLHDTKGAQKDWETARSLGSKTAEKPLEKHCN